MNVIRLLKGLNLLNAQKNLPYLPVYDARPCIICTPILDSNLKKKGSRIQRKWLHKVSVKKIMISIHSKKDDLVISSEKLCHSMHRQSMKRSVLPMDFFGGQPLQNHGYHPPSTTLNSSITQEALWVRELRSICEELNSCFLLRVQLSHFQSRELQRCHKQAGCHISPGHHVASTELQILVRFSSNFLAIIVL